MFVSTKKFYEKIAQGEIGGFTPHHFLNKSGGGFTVPAFNIRTLTFDVARAIFRAAKKQRCGAFIIELAQSEMQYTAQTPDQYAKNILKAAQAENFTGPIFLQADHFQLSDVGRQTIEELEGLIKQSIKAGFYNIDIDCSGLPLAENIKQTNYFVDFINSKFENLDISIGGEVGEIGGKNTTVEELEEFLKGVNGIIKVAVQTGTAHGRGGNMDFELLQALSEKAREYELAGVVQHGASTLPDTDFEKFPKSGACEIHLATGLQNIILQSKYFPEELKEKINAWPEGPKKALGPLKKQILSIPQKNINKICEELETRFIFFFKTLNVVDSNAIIKTEY